ncbi:MAG TPA: glycosyltransferase 87 family protein [Vicinamibacteria bacterium]|nr:glycosyltransferase 87 family protein [Vicinamibacteria bacterium]
MRRWIEPLRGAPTLPALVAVCGLALAARLALALNSVGTNDIRFWRGFGELVSTHGVVRAYALDSWFNHPPLMGWLAACIHHLSAWSGIRFEVLFKLPSIAASVAAVVLVHRSGRPGLAALALFALNPADVLVSGYHGSTDGLCAFLGALAVRCADRGRPLACGLALAAALNVKLIPVVLVVPLAAFFGRRELRRYAAALALGGLPFLPPLLWEREAFLHNVVHYSSFRGNWGLGLFVIQAHARLPALSAALWAFAVTAGKPLILASSVAAGLVQARWRAFSAWELAGLALAAFLVLTPGFGVQYLVYPVAILFVAGRRFGLAYAYLSGLFIFLVYLTYWTGTIPPYSDFVRPFDVFASLFGFAVWLMLLRHVARAILRLARHMPRRSP